MSNRDLSSMKNQPAVVLLAVLLLVTNVWRAPSSSDIIKYRDLATPPIDIKVPTSTTSYRSRLGDGCYHIYLDVGANVGVHGRFLYEPEKYTKSKHAVPMFEKMYGINRSNEDYCVFEIEANPNHWPRLEEISKAYRNVGWRYEVVKSAAFDQPGNMTFYHQDKFDQRHNEYGFSIKENGSPKDEFHSKVEVPTIRLAQWIQEELLDRQIPKTPPSGKTYEHPVIGMKFDIEAAELVVIPDMLSTGVLCQIDFMFGEYHTFLVPMDFTKPNVTVKDAAEVRFLKKAIKAMIHTARNCKTNFMFLDDEQYLHDGPPLPGEKA